MAKRSRKTTDMSLPKSVPTEKEASRKIGIAVRRHHFYTEGDAINTLELLNRNIRSGQKAIRIFVQKKVPERVVDYNRGVLHGVKYAAGLLKPIKPRKSSRGGRLLVGGKLKGQKRGSILK